MIATMKYALLFALLAATCATLGIERGRAWLLLLWPAASFAGMSMGFLTLGEKACGKSANGSIQLWARWLYAPYRVYALAIWGIAKTLSKEPASNEVTPLLSVGRRLTAQEARSNFERYIDLTSELEDPSEIRRSPGYICFPILDASVPDLKELVRLLDDLGKSRIYVHCAQGHGRTGLFALFWLARQGIIRSPEEGIRLLQSKRPGLRLNKHQLAFASLHLSCVLPKRAP